MKTLVVYHSYTGHTKLVVDMITSKIDCDVLEVKPKVPFSENYQEVREKYENYSVNDELIEIEEINVDFNEYDTIILGSPVWNFTITPVIVSFLKKYDLSGKVIYPFIVSSFGFERDAFWAIREFSKGAKVKTKFENSINYVKDGYMDEFGTRVDYIYKWIDSVKKDINES